MIRRGWLPWIVFPLIALALVGLAWTVRPYPFTSGDALPRFLPILEAHTAAAWSGHFLRTAWELGGGWSPFMSGESGIAYPVWLLAAGLSRFIGLSHGLLEVGAVLHLAAAGLVAWHGLEVADSGERALAALLLMTMPGVLILGLNWGTYLAAYPWLLGLALLLARDNDPLCTRSGRWGLAGLVLGCYLVAHVQVFVLGLGFVALATYALHPDRSGLTRLAWLAVAALPLAVPLTYAKVLATHARPSWTQAWAAGEYLIHGSADLSVAFHGFLAGNLLPNHGFRPFGDLDWRGIGIFFAPWLLVVWLEAFLARRAASAVFWTAVVAWLGLGSLPFLSVLAVGPLQGFRWTWKFTLIIGALALLAMLRLPAWKGLPALTRRAALALLALLNLAVAWRGMAFDVSYGAAEFHRLGTGNILIETRRCLAATGVPEGARLALVDWDTERVPISIPMYGLLANGPLLAGRETVHLFEPLEPMTPHLGPEYLGPGWPQYVPAASTLHPEGLRRLRALGVQFLVGTEPGQLRLPGIRRHRDAFGRTTEVAPLPDALPLAFPWSVGETGAQSLERLPGGALRTHTPLPAAPATPIKHPMSWRQETDGRWIGRMKGPAAGWWLVTALLTALSALLLHWRPARTRT